MSTADDLNPEEFAEAAAAAIADAQSRDVAATAGVLAEAGLFAVSVAEEAGGMGLPLDFSLPVARAAGELQLRFPLIEQMVLARAFAGTEAGAALASGASVGTIAWQGDLASGYAGAAGHVGQAQVVLVRDCEGAALIDLASVTVTEDKTLDPEAPSGFLALEGATILDRIDAAAHAALVADAETLYAAFAIGAGQGALDRTATYLAARVQFGRPLTAKQAVRHHLAQMKLLNEVSAAALRRSLRSDEFDGARSGGTAFAGAIANAIAIVEKAIHLHGGMGFTWEVPLHYSLRDLRRIDAALGVGKRTQAIGRAFVDAA